MNETVLAALKAIHVEAFGCLEDEDPWNESDLRIAQRRGGALDRITSILMDLEDELGLDFTEEEAK